MHKKQYSSYGCIRIISELGLMIVFGHVFVLIVYVNINLIAFHAMSLLWVPNKRIEDYIDFLVNSLTIEILR